VSTPRPLAKAANLRRNPRVVIPAVTLAVLVLLIAVFEGDLPVIFSGLEAVIRFLLRRFGAPGSLLLLYIEETGVPLPVPGDVYLVYLGRIASGSPPKLVLAWFAVVVVVVAGASNLYWASRRWGRRLLENRIALAMHIEPERILRAEAWFARWGAVAIIFGRHVPGMRIPVTVVSGIFRVSYAIFVPSVAVSTAVWAAVWIWLGARFGPTLGRLIGQHRWTYIVAAAVVILVISYVAVRVFRAPSATSTRS
jgi:membrane protein DedA with SNARE-associated domain